jgi:hypothetical protein
MKNFIVLCLLFLTACASTGSNYLFPRGRQRHHVTVYGTDGKIKADSSNFLVVDEIEAKITSLTPVSLTAMTAVAKKDGTTKLIYLSPMLAEQRPIVEALLKKLSRLLWAKRTPSDVVVKKKFEDGSAQELEWSLAKQKIFIRVEKL